MEAAYTINFETLIHDLLFEYDCVVVPGFGGFVTQFESASIKPDKNLILPPSKSISFNVNLKKNDGLLAQETAARCGLTYAQALSDIQHQVGEWEKILNNKLALNLGTIGTLRQNIDGKIEFQQNTSVNYYSEAYGLSPVYANAVEKEGISGKIKKEFEQRKAIPNYQRKIRKTAITTLSIASVLALVFYSSLNYTWFQEKSSELRLLIWGNDNNKTQENSIKTVQKTKPIAKEVELEPELELVDSSFMDTVNQIIETEKSLEIETAESSVQKTNYKNKDFLIIAGCFQSMENANNFVQELKNKGFNAFIAGQSEGGLHRVAYDNYSDLNSAQNALVEIRSKHNPSAWIFNSLH